jgi:hypothetical protein
MVRIALPSILAAALLSACSAQTECETDIDCDEGLCVRGECTDPGLPETEGPSLCTDDADCNLNQGELCMGGVCLRQDDPRATPDLGADCAVTADCEIGKYCHSQTQTCRLLEAGMCRIDEQCPDEAPMCTAQSSAVRGQCVQCMQHGDCASGSCRQGVCDDDSGNAGGSMSDGGVTDERPDNCPPGMVESAPGVCVCEDGLVWDGNSGCVEPTLEPGFCPPNSHAVEAGGCECDDGYALDPTVGLCAESTGGGGGVDTGNATCPPNSHPVSTGCDCDDGYEPSADWTECVATGSGGGGGQGSCGAGYVENCSGGCTLASWVGDGICDSALDCAAFSYDDGDCDNGGGGGGSTCGTGYIDNCNGGCTLQSWLGDNYCDSALNCAATNFDDGDCDSGGGGGGAQCTASQVENCDGGCTTASWLGDGYCDSALDCAATDYDEGDCSASQCSAGYVENCNGGCTLASWVGDGICDSALDCSLHSFDDGDCGGGSGGGATCAGYCGGSGSDGSCYCDSSCETFGDCCSDYYGQCT